MLARAPPSEPPLKWRAPQAQDVRSTREAPMELSGAGYFYTLAEVGITFAGFAALLMTVREMRGTGMSKFHLWVARSYVQSGMFTAVNAMLSPLLFGLGFSE